MHLAGVSVRRVEDITPALLGDTSEFWDMKGGERFDIRSFPSMFEDGGGDRPGFFENIVLMRRSKDEKK